MKEEAIYINKKGNGSCPLCSKRKECMILWYLKKSLDEMFAIEYMEIVVYKCDRFKDE
jgi:hypothetical protein